MNSCDPMAPKMFIIEKKLIFEINMKSYFRFGIQSIFGPRSGLKERPIPFN